MPKHQRLHQDERGCKVVANFLWGLLPDNRQTIRRLAGELETPPGEPLSILRAMGMDCPGALMFGGCLETGSMRPLSDEDMEQLIHDLEQHGVSAVAGGDLGLFSLAGAQSKVALHYDHNDVWNVPSGYRPSTHILKPRIPDLKDQDLNEDFCLRLAQRIGLRAAESFVLNIGEKNAIVSIRYDRRLLDDGSHMRLHQEDMCQALGIHPDFKYEREGGPKIKDCLELLEHHSTDPENDRRAFMKAAMFNMLICGSDAHGKNFSILHSTHGQVFLAPLYDVNSLFPYASARKDQRLAMSIGGKRKLYDIRPSHFLREARAAGMDPEIVKYDLIEMIETLPNAADRERENYPFESEIIDKIVSGIQRQSSLMQGRLAEV